MLTPEQAKAKLAQWKLPEDENRLAAGVKNLPTAARQVAEALWGLAANDDDDDLDWEARQRLQREAMAKLDKLSSKELKQLFQLISPQLVPTLKAGWELIKTTPYQIDHEQKAFRVPSCPEVLAPRRFVWLRTLGALAKQYPPEVLTPKWLATWAAHVGDDYGHTGQQIAVLLAAILRDKHSEADEIFEILRQSLTNQHEIGAMRQHVTVALLLADRPEGWELIEKTLLAAQRQEGLRQAILEAIDVSHPEAFRRMLRLILDHDLIRFSATVRAVDVWFGDMWAAGSAGVIKKMLAQLVEFLENPAARDKAIGGSDPQSAFLAMWCQATEDALVSIKSAEKLLGHKSVEMRYVAARHLANLHLDVAAGPLSRALEDADLRVALVAITHLSYRTNAEDSADGDQDDHRFEKIEQLLERVPVKSETLKPLVWPWTEIQVKRSDVACCLLGTRGKRPATRLIPHLDKMERYIRRQAVQHLVDAKPWDAAARQAILDLAGDASTDSREIAMAALQEAKLEPAEFPQLESYLTRKTGDLRRGVLDLLLKQDDQAALASAARLLASKDASQRLGGLELLRLMTDSKRIVPDCRGLATGYSGSRKKITKEEQSHLDEIAKDKVAIAALDDALGLMNPADRTPVIAPRNLKTPFITAAAVACLEAIDELVHQHHETPITYTNYMKEEQEALLGTIRWGFPSPAVTEPRESERQRLPLADVWTAWFEKRGKALRDPDGMELVRALLWSKFAGDRWDARDWTNWAKGSPARKAAANLMSGNREPMQLRYERVTKEIVEWLLFLYPVDARDFLLSATETAYALVPEEDMARLAKDGGRRKQTDEDRYDWRDEDAFSMWDDAHHRLKNLSNHELTPAQRMRRWQLLHWLDEPFPGAGRKRPTDEILLDAYDQQAATLADVADHLLGPRGQERYGRNGFDLLAALTTRKCSKEHQEFLGKHRPVRELLDGALARILDLELARGDAATAATAPSHALNALWGAATLHRILQALGKAEFKITSSWRAAGEDRRASLTHLAKVTYPAADESADAFVQRMKAAVKAGEFPEERLLQLTFLAPQWTKLIEVYFNWKSLDEGVYWFLAHMQMWGGDATAKAALAGGAEETEETVDEAADESSDDEDSNGAKPKKLSPWERLILERTPLSDIERRLGAIDVGWFRRTHALLGPKKWEAIASAARFAANASQAKRARHVGDVLLGNVKRQELIDGIKKKQLKEQVRLLGLLPLATGAKQETDLRERCQVLRDYRRYANTLSGLTKPDALRAWEIGLKNLAQSAGFADPMRLEWAVGAEAVKDLAKGPVSVTKAGVTVTLCLDEFAKPAISVAREGKELKSIPPAIKKDKQIAALTERVTDIRRQASSIKQSLESAMCRGDAFSGDELRNWCGHALLVPLLSRLVVVGEGILGYPDKGGKALRDYRGKLEPVKAKESLRFAHPYDLLETDKWHEWQHECFQAERIQPFKQVFRELYVLTKQEKKEAVSHRYDGQQVQPKQAMALFGSRGWNTSEGIFKVFHDQKLTVEVHFDYTRGTPAEVEGWTIGGVSFRPHDAPKPMKLAAVPPRLFSEVMRDLDLVVSVAHAGGVDPEASASTVEMRTGLVRETCDLLNVTNVKFKSSHAVVSGALAKYSVHLGSGTVHRMPGGHLCIIPVHAQHRGRLFLPFADDDPKTAEIISKVLLLARDQEIQDPSILEQIRAHA
jgi:hypothetical protein